MYPDTDHKVLKKDNDYILLIVGDPQEILEQHLRPRPIHLSNFIIFIILINYIKLYII